MNDNLQNMSMVELFRMEAESQLAALTEGLLSLERGNTAPLEAMMRAAHSLKGAGRIVGIDAAVAVADRVGADHRGHRGATRAELRELAADLGLVVTGSSDYHGSNKVDHDLGCNLTAPDQLEALLSRSVG